MLFTPRSNLMLPRNKAQSLQIGGTVIYCCTSGDSAAKMYSRHYGYIGQSDTRSEENFYSFWYSAVHLLVTNIHWSPNSKKILYWSMNQSVGHSELKTESPVFPSTLFYIFEALSSDYLCQQMRRFRNTNTQIYFPYEYWAGGAQCFLGISISEQL